MSIEPTLSRGKERLPKDWSYPLSAREVEEQVVPIGFGPLGLYFLRRSHGLRASERMSLLRSGRSIPILEMWYSNPRSTVPSTALGRDSKSYLEPTWSVYVCAVPRGSRAVCRRALLEGGIEAARKWLMTERPDTWYRGFRTFKVWVVPATGQLECKEAA